METEEPNEPRKQSNNNNIIMCYYVTIIQFFFRLFLLFGSHLFPTKKKKQIAVLSNANNKRCNKSVVFSFQFS